MAKYSTRDIVVRVYSSKKSKEFKNLHIAVMTKRTLSGAPNTSSIVVYNLNQDSRDFLSAIYDNGQPNMKVEVLLNDSSVFIGDLVNSTSLYNMGTWETSLYGCEGYYAYRATIDKKFEKGSTRTGIIESIFGELKQFGINTVDAQAIKNGCGNKSILKQIYATANIWDNVQNLFKDCFPSFDAFIDGDTVTMLPKDQVLGKSIELSFFLEPPTLNEAGVKCKILIDPFIKIGSGLTVKAKSFNRSFGSMTLNRAQKSRFSGEGNYKIIESVSTFDNFTNKVATTDITAVFLT